MPPYGIRMDRQPTRARSRSNHGMAGGLRVLRRRQQSQFSARRRPTPTKLFDTFPPTRGNRRSTRESRRNRRTAEHPDPWRSVYHFPEHAIRSSIKPPFRFPFMRDCALRPPDRQILKPQAVWCVYSDTHRIMTIRCPSLGFRI